LFVELIGVNHRKAGRGQFDGERKTIEALADLRNDRQLRG
jgi:hypothetical protein